MFSEYRRFFASPKIGSIEGFDCIRCFILLDTPLSLEEDTSSASEALSLILNILER